MSKYGMRIHAQS